MRRLSLNSLNVSEPMCTRNSSSTNKVRISIKALNSRSYSTARCFSNQTLASSTSTVIARSQSSRKSASTSPKCSNMNRPRSWSHQFKYWCHQASKESIIRSSCNGQERESPTTNPPTRSKKYSQSLRMDSSFQFISFISRFYF